MPLLRLFRVSAALRVTPIAVVLVVLNLLPALEQLQPYWLAASAQASAAIIILGPISAACGAWEAGRLRQGTRQGMTPVRGEMETAVWHLIPVAAMVVVALLVSMAISATTAYPAPGVPDLRFVGLAFLLAMSFAALGYALGGLLRPIYSVPIMLIAVLLWLVYPRALTPFWLRHLTGNFYQGCCALEQVIDPRALLAPAVLGCGVAVAALALISRDRWRQLAIGAAGIVLAGSAVGAWSVVRDLGPDSTLPRTHGDICVQRESQGSELEICVWREHRQDLAAVEPVLIAAVGNLNEAGLTAPTKLTEGTVTTPRTWQFTIIADSSRQDVLFSLATGLLPPFPACAEGNPWAGAPAGGPQLAWFARQAGLSTADISARLDPADVALTERILTKPRPVQQEWVAENIRALTTCGVAPPEGP